MKKDILNKEDIKKIMIAFYDKIRKDEVLGHFFNKVAPVNWEEHTAVLCDFWENVLFYTGNYEGNPLVTHRTVNAKYNTTKEHFDRWHLIFDEIVDSLYTGSNATKMKEHARSISTIMQQKM